MIYTVTFNPALDYVVKVEHFALGSVNRTIRENIFYGGKGINVSALLANLGYRSTALGFIAGFTGREIERGVRSLGPTRKVRSTAWDRRLQPAMWTSFLRSFPI